MLFSVTKQTFYKTQYIVLANEVVSIICVCVSLGIYHSKWRLIIVFQGHLGQTNLPYILQQKPLGKWNSIINGGI
jgi:hypothetical protein